MTDTIDMTYDGVAVPAARYRAQGAGRPRWRAVLGVLLLGLGIGYAGISVWDRLVDDAATYRCPPDCGRPPNAVPVANLPRFTAAGGAWSVAHPAPGGVYDISTAPDGVTARMTTGDGGVLRMFSQPAGGRLARQVIDQYLAKQYPNYSVAYELPNAMVGYRLGYGVIVNFQTPGLSVRDDMRAVVIAAVKDDIALIALAEGPFRRFTKEFGPGPPSGANLEIAMDMGRYVDSFRWKGDPIQ